MCGNFIFQLSVRFGSILIFFFSSPQVWRSSYSTVSQIVHFCAAAVLIRIDFFPHGWTQFSSLRHRCRFYCIQWWPFTHAHELNNFFRVIFVRICSLHLHHRNEDDWWVSVAATARSTWAECTKNFWQTADDSERVKFCLWRCIGRKNTSCTRTYVNRWLICSLNLWIQFIFMGKRTMRNSSFNWKFFDECLVCTKSRTSRTRLTRRLIHWAFVFCFSRTQPEYGGSRFFSVHSVFALLGCWKIVLPLLFHAVVLCLKSMEHSVCFGYFLWVTQQGSHTDHRREP